ncbi:type II secretion system F family protein [Abyssibius alkaniclasticus]|uniref:type II secretion system F family protein n=1 Tax=Abyssibius alkaniclasticus TaxID=2881234 RepID=UPI0023639CBE|nr:type II secretion system F family protein [Abyssibius alkaniclasticus]UPH71463.1 type II secretion system F family protein [Abyssibius alkaniclasticus]
MSAISYSYEFIIAALGPLGPLMVAGGIGLLLIIISIPFAMKSGPNPFERLGRGSLGFSSGDGEKTALNLRYNSGKFDLSRFDQYLTPQDQKEFSAVRLKLIQAGYRSKSAVSNFAFARMAGGLTLILLGVLLMLLRGKDFSAATAAFYIIFPGVIGYYGPTYWVERRRQSRQEMVTNGFPDALDMMLICVEAGQSLDQAILRVAKEIKNSNEALAEEFEIVANEIRAGKERVVVLRDMAERCGVNDISAFVTVLVQSATFGTSISDALRVYAAEMRDKRVMRAEEKANVLPTKLTLGTMLFTVPPLLIILVGPSILDIYINLLGGGV